MSQITLELLLEKINNLTEKMATGFTGVHRRLDITNGRMTKHEEKSAINKGGIIALEKEDIKIKEKIKSSKLFWITMTALISICLGLAGFIIGKYF